jgi:hypothetical protein
MDYYDEIKATSGFYFFLQFEETCSIIEDNSFLYQRCILHFHRAFIDDFPCVMYYKIDETLQEVEILTTLHSKCGNEFIKSKLKN